MWLLPHCDHMYPSKHGSCLLGQAAGVAQAEADIVTQWGRSGRTSEAIADTQTLSGDLNTSEEPQKFPLSQTLESLHRGSLVVNPKSQYGQIQDNYALSPGL